MDRPADPTDPISVEEWQMNLWFEDGVLESVQWGVPLGEEDAETWPA